MPQKKSVYLETFGCQMNELDSELVTGQLESLGYEIVDRDTSADVVLYNTCSVREQAENKAWSRIGLVSQRKRDGEEIILGVLGCMAERDGHDLLRRHPEVDLMCGPGELDQLPMLLDNIARARALELQRQAPLEHRVALGGSRSRRWSTLQAAQDNLEMLDLSRAFHPDPSARAAGRSAYVRITRGCNKFCTYCVVPHTRGAEVHRPPADIVEECRILADQGVLEITLLGQTVNHYCYTHGTALSVAGKEVAQVGPGLNAFRKRELRRETATRTTSFADLLHLIHESVPSIQRLRFVTSYPRDFGDEVLQVIADSERICSYLHVPAQSGSNRILKLMNRGYSVEQYLDFIERACALIPDVSIAGDIIVGFPTETEEDFEATINLLRKVPFKNNFIFKYSERPGTVARGRFADDVPLATKKRRNNELLAVQAEVSAAVHQRWVGRETTVLVEQISKQEQTRTRKNSLAAQGGVTLTANGASLEQTQLSETPNSVPKQLSGRTSGDLIVFFDCPPKTSPETLIGTIQPISITRSSALNLYGTLNG
ncbi:MAG: hypothetical protein CBC35_03350 [Planctomycetes bacterium TMED75]|nr:tRNA (N6-isopentenyl adenosine(37)-C2)-methylthiotransferase MiaB [Planctomycetaceae bacterium]OUU94878.1 MAG: hypothetical protein CBC35_03350 [Planctomycetes bacterium TMED75]